MKHASACKQLKAEMIQRLVKKKIKTAGAMLKMVAKKTIWAVVWPRVSTKWWPTEKNRELLMEQLVHKMWGDLVLKWVVYLFHSQAWACLLIWKQWKIMINIVQTTSKTHLWQSMTNSVSRGAKLAIRWMTGGYDYYIICLTRLN